MESLNPLKPENQQEFQELVGLSVQSSKIWK